MAWVAFSAWEMRLKKLWESLEIHECTNAPDMCLHSARVRQIPLNMECSHWSLEYVVTILCGIHIEFFISFFYFWN